MKGNDIIFTIKRGRNTAKKINEFQFIFEPIFLSEVEDDTRIDRLSSQIIRIQRQRLKVDKKDLEIENKGGIFGVEYEKKLGIE